MAESGSDIFNRIYENEKQKLEEEIRSRLNHLEEKASKSSLSMQELMEAKVLADMLDGF